MKQSGALPAGMTAANWRAHPHAPWAFAHPDEFLPTLVVPAAREARPLPDEAPLGAGMFSALAQETHCDGMIVLHHGRVVHEHYGANLKPTGRHLGFSVSKAITGLLAEWRIAEGALNERARAADYAADLIGTPFADAFLRDLLDMRDGVAFDEDYARPDADIHVYSRHFWGDGEGGVAAALRALPHGSTTSAGEFRYRTPVSDAIGLILEGATGIGLARQTSRLWTAAGAADDALWVRDTGGRAIASAGFACTLRDLARFGVAMVEAVRGDGSPALVRAANVIAAGGDQAAFARSGQPTRPEYSYRSGWWIDHPNGALNALGVFGQRLHIVPEAGLVIARFGSSPTASNQSTDALHARWFASIRDALDAR